MKATVTIYENVAPVGVNTVEDLLAQIECAELQAQQAGRANIIFVEAPGGNSLSLVVGAEGETVLGFEYGHGDPPYYASKGNADTDHPVMEAFVSLNHHTEFLRRWVIPTDIAISALCEFLVTGERPAGITWIEI